MLTPPTSGETQNSQKMRDRRACDDQRGSGRARPPLAVGHLAYKPKMFSQMLAVFAEHETRRIARRCTITSGPLAARGRPGLIESTGHPNGLLPV
jgi:hypothetical protein